VVYNIVFNSDPDSSWSILNKSALDMLVSHSSRSVLQYWMISFKVPHVDGMYSCSRNLEYLWPAGVIRWIEPCAPL
jgi:hypothetical protein